MIVLAPGWPDIPGWPDTPAAPTPEDITETITFQQVQQRGIPESTCLASGFQESNSERFSTEVAERIKGILKKSISIKVGHLWAMGLTESDRLHLSNCSPGRRVSKLLVHS